MPKYIFVDGVMKIDPAYQAEQAKQGNQQTVADPSKALAIVSSTQDIGAASAAQQAATGRPMQLSEATTSSMEIMQDPDYLKRFNAPTALDGGNLLDGLTAIFSKYEVPLGLVNKLLALSEYKLNFIIDDSGSMGNKTDAFMSTATPYIKQMYDRTGSRAAAQDRMTRWEEAQDRLHVMIDMLAYIPTGTISISFMNRQDRLTLEHSGKTPEQFAADAHNLLLRSFTNGPAGGTPIYRCLSQSFTTNNQNTMHYLFTDGEPSDATQAQVGELVLHRQNPKQNPLSFITCSNDDEETKWMKEIEEDAPFTSELDDFIAERNEVLKDQGPGFPFSKGFWLICQLVASINPLDLDALDESCPLTKKTLDDLLGRRLSPEEYFRYFDSNPNALKYRQLFNEFKREDLLARDVLRNASLATGQAPTPGQMPAPAPVAAQARPYGAPAPTQAPVPAPVYGAPQNPGFFNQPAPQQQQPQQQYAPQGNPQAYAPPANPQAYAPPGNPYVSGNPQAYAPQGQQQPYAPQAAQQPYAPQGAQQPYAPNQQPGAQPAYNQYRK